MDYKEKYEQALERAKYYHDRDNIQFLENIFPELKENEDEDERIRKQTLKVLNYYKDEEKSEGRMPTEIEECIAWLEKQGEQKPTDKYEPMSLNEAIEHCKEKSCGNNACALEHKQLEKWLIELKELKEKKPWGEEDEQMYNTIVNSLNRDQVERVWNTTEEEVDNWLKFLKDRVQPRLELSECDKRIIDNLISQLGNLFARKLIKKETKDKYINWLKSLRPQSQWKPSNEHLHWLKWAINRMPDTEKSNEAEAVLEELLEDLKKLMEEYKV